MDCFPALGQAGTQAVAQRPKDHVTQSQGTGFIQWLLAAAQLFHTGRSSNRSLPLKQQRSVVAPEPVTTIEKEAVNPRTLSPGSCTELKEGNSGNNAVSLPVGNLDPPPCPPT
ncbi:hypothetical protein FQN60_009055 [Etheostoma spectabile]|uniref:Uncharacterized protein n=1 Tax=Etheostoma spectabile TaxID=54343 RepID=A0A5J5CNI5_9PERO|nr:hypothetical protein FQN60_009055 [Etheostoma spectabile]